MPELPEVETIARQLDESLKNRVIKFITINRSKNFLGESSLFFGKKIKEVSRKAKLVRLEVHDSDDLIQIHLKMTGQLIFVDGEKRVVGGHPTSDWVRSLPSKHTRVIVGFVDGSNLFFNDMRAFGWMKIISRTQEFKNSETQPPDVVDKEFSLEYFTKVLGKYKRPIKIVLLDQQLMGGIGNIYANDALNLAKILPMRKANEINKKETIILYEAIKTVIDLGIEKGGASAANYVDTKGLGGTYQNYFLTYKREGHPCKNCGEKIVKIKLGGRGTFYCPGCQK